MQTKSYRRRGILRSGGAALLAGSNVGFTATVGAQPLTERLLILCNGPAGSIPDIIARRIGEQSAGSYAQCRPELATSFQDTDMVPVSSRPADLAARIKVEQQYWEPIIRGTGIRVE